MRRDERRRGFHDALLKMLYPSPPPPSQQEDGDKLLDISPKGLDDVDPVPDDLKENSSSASDEDDECAPQKLTRAQRKRLRQKKLKETASCRRKIIGPQLPSPSGGDLEDKPPKIPHSAADELVDAMGKPGNTPTRRNQTKLKQRRMAKKLAREREKSSNMENCNEDGYPHGTDGSLT
ncbi:hypothetical protein PVL29_026782 [Vitis rotundifolia]|uniref:Uncharacterized protein n=1 Tax=Vitis rotundifolia TaxID=103349 RepID=A0AA38YHB7_VITRO|nr:hypothetical protein PVL29_026782 [Vitis rotundifolia]